MLGYGVEQDRQDLYISGACALLRRQINENIRVSALMKTKLGNMIGNVLVAELVLIGQSSIFSKEVTLSWDCMTPREPHV